MDIFDLDINEFEQKIDQMLFVSATPNVYEQEHELLRAEQIIRPTGLVDPKISVRPIESQITDLKKEIEKELAAEEEQTSGPSDTSNAKTLRSIPAKSIWLSSEMCII